MFASLHRHELIFDGIRIFVLRLFLHVVIIVVGAVVFFKLVIFSFERFEDGVVGSGTAEGEEVLAVFVSDGGLRGRHVEQREVGEMTAAAPSSVCVQMIEFHIEKFIFHLFVIVVVVVSHFIFPFLFLP